MNVKMQMSSLNIKDLINKEANTKNMLRYMFENIILIKPVKHSPLPLQESLNFLGKGDKF